MVKDTVQKLAEENARNLADRCFGSGSKGRRRFATLLPQAAGGNQAAIDAGIQRWRELWATVQTPAVQINVAEVGSPSVAESQSEAQESSGRDKSLR